MTNIDALSKGNALESAVQAIERAILSQAPGYSEGTFKIESKKRILVAGVHHEIDIYVSAMLAVAYDALFIFECKNWEDKVSKNEIIVFSEKIRASGAQRGFFVAKSFTKDAEAQAASDARLVLLRATELDPATLIVPLGLHGIQLGDTNAAVKLLSPGAGPDNPPRPFEIDGAAFVLDGQTADLDLFAQTLVGRLREERPNAFSSGTAAEGVHSLDFSGAHEFAPGQATVNGKPLGKMQVDGRVDVHVSKAVVVSGYEVASRGRHITVQLSMPVGRLMAEFVELDSKSS